MIDLVKDSYSCCGCGACMNVCPKGAIEMREDPAGFKFPHIDTSKCIECGLCLKVCKFENPELVYPRAAYICQLKDENTLSFYFRRSIQGDGGKNHRKRGRGIRLCIYGK